MKNKYLLSLFFMLILLGITISLIAINYSSLPENIPTHYGFSGEPQSWGPKLMIFLFPGLQVLFLALSLVINRYPNYANIPSTIALKHLSKDIKEKAYEVIRNTVFLIMSILSFLMFYLTKGTLEVAKGQAASINNWIFLFILLSLAPPIVYYAVKMRNLS